MSVVSWIDKVIQYVPEIKRPLRRLSLAERIRNTAIIVISYIILMNTIIPTVNKEWIEKYQMLQFLYGTKFGSIATIGTSAIVIGALIAEIIGFKYFDLETREGRDKMMKFQKFIIILMTIYFGITYALRMSNPGLVNFAVTAVFFIIGGFIVYLMDDYITKYGFGSGISWFILASVSSSLIAGLFDPLKDPAGRYYGFVWRIVDYFHNPDANVLYGDPTTFFYLVIMPIIATFGLLLFIVFFDQTKVKLASSRMVRIGKRLQKLPPVEIKFTYLSVMPIIFTVFAIEGIYAILAPFQSNPTVHKILYYISMPYGYPSWFDKLHWLVYGTLFFIIGVPTAVAFSKMTKMDEAHIGEALKIYYQNFRRVESPAIKRARMIMKSLPYISALISVFIALLGNFFGVIGTGSGLILLVGITAQFKDAWKAYLKFEKKDTKTVLREAFGEWPIVGPIVRAL